MKAASTLHYHDFKVEISFVCPCGKGEVHPATVGAGKKWWICSRDVQVTDRLGENHTIWLSKASLSSGELVVLLVIVCCMVFLICILMFADDTTDAMQAFC